MKLYLIGISGMLGSKLFLEFLKNPNYEVKGSARKIPKIFLKHKKYIDANCDIQNFELIKKNLIKFHPDVVINCVGIIKQKLSKNNNKANTFFLNSIFPHELFKITNLIKSRLIHFSTDCVFNGEHGNYREKQFPNANDVYGFSKMLGELHYKNSLTLRTSIIGHELNNKLSLLEWFLNNKKTCSGYANAYFSGFPTYEIYKILTKILKKKNIYGVYHLSSQKISKYILLKKISKIYKKTNIKITKDTKVKIDRSLNSSRLKKIINYKSPSWNKLIHDMYKNHRNNKKLSI